MKKKIVIISVFSFILLLVVIYCIAPRGGIVYFNPGDLKLYEKTELLLPFTSIPIYRSFKRYKWEYEIISFSLEKGWIQRKPREEYEDVFVEHWSPTWKDGYIILHSKFCGMESSWIDWSNEYPEVASKFWADIVALLRADWKKNEQYICYLLDHGQDIKTLEEYKEKQDFIKRNIL